MNKKILYGVYIASFLGVAIIVPKIIKPKTPHTTTDFIPNTTSTANMTITSTSSQNPEDVIAGLYPNPIKNSSTKEDFKINSILAENNIDSSGNPVNDHLEMTLQNLTNRDLTNFEVYYTITDTTANKKEGYYKKLDNFVLKSGTQATIHFDNGISSGHFSVNTNSLYYKTTDALHFDVQVSTPGSMIESIQVDKAAGGAETKD